MANFVPKFEYVHPVNGVTVITLDLPPTGDPLKEAFETAGSETRSNAGKSQYQKNYQDHTYELTFIFLTKQQKDDLFEMFDSYASFGSQFKYFESSDEANFLNVEWPGSKKVFKPVKVIRSGADFIYDLTIPIRVAL